ncbi:DUF309 domain-containing protein [Enhygromyxa salina]|uniref:DUF309 domain-containing protein n=1 Tax=Enhygromyxa salina TaxID=215803 RepID=A0A2S9YN88_9BACT|nr:DUF309 domain-containing protein [Enhygromyxa salina]PRQ06548.1 hypothetical protein ENSA7_38680 [Enhygromyxa salina]
MPGRGERPAESLASTWDGDPERLRSQVEYRWGIDLYNCGYYWEAHESWESLWRQAPRGTATHALLQGLIQCAAAALKARTGQHAASRRIAARALAKLESALISAPGEIHAGLDIPTFTTDFRAFMETTPGSGVPPKLRLRGL